MPGWRGASATTDGVRVEAHPASTKPRAKSATPARSSTVLESTPPPARRSSSFSSFFALRGPRRRPRAARRGASWCGSGGPGAQATVLAPACRRSMPPFSWRRAKSLSGCAWLFYRSLSLVLDHTCVSSKASKRLALLHTLL